MTQVWQGETVVPVTKVEAGPCTILQLKTNAQDGYTAVQVGYGSRRASLISKALKGHFQNLGDFRFVREFRVTDSDQSNLKTGDVITVKTFAPGDKLTVVGISKGKGFQGVVKRHGFHGQDATHGNKDQLRMSGSVGAGGVQHVFKGLRMGGRMGGDRVTLHDVEVVTVDEASNSILLKGAVPGARNGLVLLSANGELITGAIEPAVEAEPEQVIETAEQENVETREAIEEKVEEAPADTEVKEEVKTEKEVEAPVNEEISAVSETPIEETPASEPTTKEESDQPTEAVVAESEKTN